MHHGRCKQSLNARAFSTDGGEHCIAKTDYDDDDDEDDDMKGPLSIANIQ